MTGDSFGINSRFHPVRACEPDDDAPLSWIFGPNGDDWTSTATVGQIATVTGLSHAEVRDGITRLERRGLLHRIAS